MLLDTSFLIDLMNGDRKAVARARALEGADLEVRIPSPALFELWRGVHLATRGSEDAARVGLLLAAYGSVPLDAPSAARGGEVDAMLIRARTPIDPEDSMIAGIALTQNEPLLTRNVKDFSRVPGLGVETY